MVLDENLPVFFLRPSGAGVSHHRDIFLSHHGSEPAPAYTLQHADPSSPSPAHKNCYAAAIFDAYNPEVLFAEVMARPGWTRPTLSAEELRRNNGVPPPPQPVTLTDFTVQLYEPDQQVRVTLQEGKWGASDHYEFSMPVDTFRTPSASNLDRGQSDPASLAVTPKVHFAWRKESKLSKDLTCFMTGRSTDTREKKKSKRDPDIAIALWRSMRELTVYETNLSRLELEDPKGLEVVLLLSAVVIKDLYLGNKEHIRETYNVSDISAARKLSAGGRKLSNSRQSIVGAPNPLTPQPTQPQGYPAPLVADTMRNSLPKLQTTPPAAARSGPSPPVTDPRTQWALDAETARLKAFAESEAREEKQRRRAREKADEAEAKRLQQQIENEERQARQKKVEVDKETERLRKLYGVQPLPQLQRPQAPQANSSSSRHQRPQGPYMQAIPQGTQVNMLQPQRPSMGSNGLYTQPSAASSSLAMMSGGNPSASTLNVGSGSQGKAPTKKKSFFGLRSASDDGTDERRNKLNKKASAMW